MPSQGSVVAAVVTPFSSRCQVLKAKEANESHIASVHTQDHIKLMRDISSKEYDSSRDDIANGFNSIYFNEGSSESAFLAAGSVIEVISTYISCIILLSCTTVLAVSVHSLTKLLIWQVGF
jgi:acetoin utilization deacetylase AcuC-like enzyme